jgi:hypothetical protein
MGMDISVLGVDRTRMSARRSRVAVDVSPRHTLPYSRARSWVRLLVLLLKAWSLRGT